MGSANAFSPNWVSATGNTIRDLLVQKKMSQSDLAFQIGESATHLDDVIRGDVRLNDKMAQILEQALGGTQEFWLQRDKLYHENRQRLNAVWLMSLPIKDMLKSGWIKQTQNLLKECLDFFGVPNIQSWHEKYSDVLGKVAFRTSLSFESQVASVTVWLRQGEIISNRIKVKKWNKELFRETLMNIRSLTKRKSPSNFLPTLIMWCAECGVAVAVVRTPKGCSASGATKFISSDNAMIILSFRHLTDDQFWFTFYHEAAHLILHTTSKLLIEEVGGEIDITKEEEEANLLAADFLLPQPFQEKLQSLGLYSKNIVRFAVEAGISPGIVVGQLQFMGRLDFSRLNTLKRRYSLDELNN